MCARSPGSVNLGWAETSSSDPAKHLLYFNDKFHVNDNLIKSSPAALGCASRAPADTHTIYVVRRRRRRPHHKRPTRVRRSLLYSEPTVAVLQRQFSPRKTAADAMPHILCCEQQTIVALNRRRCARGPLPPLEMLTCSKKYAIVERICASTSVVLQVMYQLVSSTTTP